MLKRLLKTLSPFILCLPLLAFGSSFDMPSYDNSIIGETQAAQMQKGDDFSSIAQKYDLGYYEIFEANPGVDPDNPQPGTVLIIPTKYIIPDHLVQDSVVINLAEMRIYYKSSKLHKIFTYPIGIGKEGWNTPTGSFKIIQKIEHPVWHVPKSIYDYRAQHGDKVPKAVPAGKNNPLGDYALRLSNPTYLIHGTDDPVGIGRRSSAGCIRLYPNDIKELFSMVTVGTPVYIINNPFKAGKQDKQIYLEAHLPLHEQEMKWQNNPVIPATNEIKHELGANNSTIDWQKVKTITDEHLGIPESISTSKTSKPSIKTPQSNISNTITLQQDWQQSAFTTTNNSCANLNPALQHTCNTYDQSLAITP